MTMLNDVTMKPETMERRYQLLLDEIGYFLETFSYEYEAYLDLETWDVVPCAITPNEKTEFYPEEGHRVIQIETRPGYKSYDMMVNFLPLVEDEKLRTRLFQALNHSKPFSRFKNIIYNCDRDTTRQWNNFRNEQLKKAAEEWLQENKVSIEGTRLVSPCAKPFIFKERFCDDLFDDELFSENNFYNG